MQDDTQTQKADSATAEVRHDEQESGHHFPTATVKREELSDGSLVWNILITSTELYATSAESAERHCRRINIAIQDAILGLHPIDDDSDNTALIERYKI